MNKFVISFVSALLVANLVSVYALIQGGVQINTGISFGFAPEVESIVVLFVYVLYGVWVSNIIDRESDNAKVALGVIGGSFAQMIYERFSIGGVVDYWSIGKTLLVNVGDLMVSAGVVVFLISQLRKNER